MPVEIARAVWERDRGQCSYVDSEGRRCSERRFVTFEHREPFALGGPATLDNVCLFCARHNAESALAIFGEQHIQDKIKARKRRRRGLSQHEAISSGELDGASPPDVPAKVLAALCHLGFRRRSATAAIERVCASEPDLQAEQLLRKSLLLLCPAPN